MVHTGGMSSAKVRQSVTLPSRVATQVNSKQQEFLKLAEQFRNETEPQETERLGNDLGRIIFG